MPLVVGIVFIVASSIFSGTHISNFLQTSFGQDTTFDHLGRVLRDYIPQEELDKTILVGDNNTNMERALFGALTGGATLTLVGPAGFDAASVPSDKLWLVRVGEPSIKGLGAAHIMGTGFQIHSLSDSNSLKPRNNQIFSTSSLCTDKVWACGLETVIDLGPPGSAEVFDIVLEVSELASLGNLEFESGGEILTGQLDSGMSAISLSFPTNKYRGELIIRVALNSPAQLGSGDRLVRVVSVNAVTK